MVTINHLMKGRRPRHVSLVRPLFSSAGSPRQKLDRKMFYCPAVVRPAWRLYGIQCVGVNLTIGDVLGELDGVDDGSQQESADCNKRLIPPVIILLLKSYGRRSERRWQHGSICTFCWGPCFSGQARSGGSRRSQRGGR